MKQSFEFLSNDADEKSTESCVKFDTDDVSNEAETAVDEPSLENIYQNDQNADNDKTFVDRGDRINVEDTEGSEKEDEEERENNSKNSAVGETTSIFDSQIGRSNTFHYVRNCEKRKGIKKHPTVSGVPGADVKIFIPKIKIARSYDNQIAVSKAAPPSSLENCTLEALFKQISESQVTLQKLNQENLRLKLELAVYKERSRDKNFRVDDNNNNYNHARYSLPADNYSTLEEMRRLSTNLDEKRRDYTHLIDDKQFDLDKREKMLADREIQMERQVNELRGRWAHLHQVWEYHRVSGLPLTPMPPFLSIDMPMPPPSSSIHGPDVRMPLMPAPSSNSDSSYVSAPSPGSSNDMKTVLEPSVMTNCSSNIVSSTQQQTAIQEYSVTGEISQCLPLPPFGFFPPPASGGYNMLFAGAASGSMNVYRSPNFNEVPPSLQGSLVHKGYLQPVIHKGVLPSKLSGKHLTPAESFSSKLFSQRSSKKTSPTMLKNRSHRNSSLEKIFDESTTPSTTEISSKEKLYHFGPPGLPASEIFPVSRKLKSWYQMIALLQLNR
uniref:Uncharacterized protein n=1 Tax=Romanomermis culicivorax TaxID=13658 RepID=A0A915HIC3_ROMCU